VKRKPREKKAVAVEENKQNEKDGPCGFEDDIDMSALIQLIDFIASEKKD